MSLEHKDIVFPEVDLSDDDGDPGWEKGRAQQIPGSTHYEMVQQPGQHAAYWKIIRDSWERTARRYEDNPDDFYSAWLYLNSHPVYWRFHPHPSHPDNHILWLETEYGFGSDGVNVDVVRVKNDSNVPVSEDEDEDEDAPPARTGTHTEIWLETGRWSLLPGREAPVHVHTHDYELDTGAPTFEEAVIKLARKVHKSYGNDRRIADAPDAA